MSASLIPIYGETAPKSRTRDLPLMGEGTCHRTNCDLFEPLKDVEGKLSGFVSNLPYIPSDNLSGLQAEVGRHEPRVALDGGINGMDDLLHLCKGAVFMLKPGGFFAFETNGEEQCKYLVEYVENDVADNPPFTVKRL